MYVTGKQAEDRFLGSYRLLRLLGSGEYGAVYLGEHVYLKTQAAIKLLHRQLIADELELFLVEARALAQLVHPHIIRVLDFGVERDIPFLIMDYAPDGTLRQIHPAGVALTCANVLRYVKQIASALQYAHYHGVIHRDIKPDNMLVGRHNEVLLSDFGIATRAHRASGEVQRHMVEGNCAYMAPEQFRGQPCPASDQYALGIMVYEWLTGSRPFCGSEIALMVQHQSTPPPSLRERCATIPPAVEQVVLQALAKQPQDRFESVEAFAQALSLACEAVSPAALLPPAPSRAQLAFQFGRAHDRPLVGRAREWEAVVHLLSTVERALPLPTESLVPERGAVPRSALLVGELGIGKTRLAEETAREAQRRGWTVAWGRGYAHESSVPYRLWMEVIQNLLHVGAWQMETDDLETIPASLRRFFLSSRSSEQFESAGPTPLPQQERLLLWVAAHSLFTKIAQRAPLLVVLDDLHWADESSIELLAYLVRHLAEQRVLFVATYRQTELDRAHALVALEPALRYEGRVVKLALAPLSSEEIALLLSGLPLARIQEIQAQAGGNPFFAEQLACSASEGDSSRERSPAVRRLSAIPGTLTAALERRVGMLSVACQQLLSIAAVLGGSFSHRALHDMLQADQQEEEHLLDLLDEAIGAGILVEEGTRTAITYHFWHPLVVTYLYERLSAARRVHLHRTAAQTLLRCYQGREEEVAAAIAFHLVECGSGVSSIVRYAEMAADHAFRLSAYTEAARHYHLAVEHLAESSEQLHTEQAGSRDLHLASLLERLAECRMIQGAFSEARGHYERILEIRMRWLELASPTGTSSAEGAEAASAWALLWSEIARAWRMTGDYGWARQYCELAEAILAASGVGDGPVLANLRLQESYISWQEGHYATARELALEALQFAKEPCRCAAISHPPVLPTRIARVLEGGSFLLGEVHELLSTIASSLGQSAEALSHLALALELFEQVEDPCAIAHVAGTLGYTHLMRGEDALARMHLSRSFALAEQVVDRTVMAVASLNLGELAARSGALLVAEMWFKRSLALTQQVGDRETEIWVRDSLAAVYRDQGRFVDALECLKGAIRLSRAIGNMPCLGLALVALGQVRLLQAQAGMGRTNYLRRARAEVCRALTFEHLYAEPRTAGRLVLAQVALLSGDLESAWREANQALAEAQASDLVLLLGRAQRLLGTILARQGKLEQADQCFEQALQVCHVHHMELERARTLHLYAEALLARCVGANSSAMTYYQRALNYLQEAHGICTACYAALDSRLVEHALQQAPSKRPFLGWC